MGGASSSFGGLGDMLPAIADTAAVAAAPATGGMSLAGAGLMGGASLLGGMMANDSNQSINSANQAFNANQAQAQMNFQKQMRATQYQTAVADMKQAGLNPMLAYTQGGAGNLQGSAATATAPIKQENVIGAAAASALQGASIKADIEQKTAAAEQSYTQADVNETEKGVNDAKSKMYIAQALDAAGVSPQKKQEIITQMAVAGAQKAAANQYNTQARSNSAQETYINSQNQGQALENERKRLALIGERNDAAVEETMGPVGKGAAQGLDKALATGSTAAQFLGAGKGTSALPIHSITTTKNQKFRR